MNYAFLAAAGLSAFAVVVHIMLGRQRPLPAPTAPREVLLYMDALFGRHSLALLLTGMALCFGYAAREYSQARDLAVVVTALAGLLAGLRFVLAIPARAPRLDIQEWGLMALACGVGVVGINFGERVTF